MTENASLICTCDVPTLPTDPNCFALCGTCWKMVLSRVESLANSAKVYCGKCGEQMTQLQCPNRCFEKPKAHDWRADLVEVVKKHALENYEQGGWDFVVETMTDRTIREDLWPEANAGRGPWTVAGAIKKMGRIVWLLDEHRRDIVTA